MQRNHILGLQRKVRVIGRVMHIHRYDHGTTFYGETMRLFEDCKCGKQREIPKYTRRYVFYLAYSYYPRKVDELQRRLRNELEKRL